MALDFAQVVQFWIDIGVFNVILPFILIFTISFAILQKSGILGTTNKSFNVVISLVLGLLFIGNPNLVGIVLRFLPNVSLFMVVIIMFLLLLGVFGGGANWSKGMLGLAAVASFLFIVWALASDSISGRVVLPNWLVNISGEAKATIIFLGILIILIWLVTREPSKREDGRGRARRFLEGIGEEVGNSGK